MDSDTISRPQTILIGAFVLVFLFLVTQRITTYLVHQKLIKQHGCQPPVKLPHKDPFFGIDEIRDALRAAKSKTFLERKRGQYEQHGNTFSSRLATLDVISTIEPENVKTVLFTKFADYVVGFPRRNAFSPLLGNSIILSDGARWEHSRALLRSCFTRNEDSDLTILELHVKNLIQAIPRDQSTVDLGDLFQRFTADVTTDFMFGESVLSLVQPDSLQADLTRAIHEAQLGCEQRFRLGRFARFVRQPGFYKAVKDVHRFMKAYVDKALEYRASLSDEELQQHSKDIATTNERSIFMHKLSKLTNNRQVLQDELLTIFFAGRDTTSALLSNLFFVLARNPHIWQRLRAEIDQLQGARPTIQAMKAMTYLRYCINETLRLYPPIPSNSRIALRDTILPIGGGPSGESPVFVSAGSLVVYHVFALHRRPDIWGPDTSEFRPERWEKEKSFKPWSFLPFNGGPRNCIGQQFALTETLYTTIRVVQEFAALSSRDSRPWTEKMGATCGSANGVLVEMVPN